MSSVWYSGQNKPTTEDTCVHIGATVVSVQPTAVSLLFGYLRLVMAALSTEEHGGQVDTARGEADAHACVREPLSSLLVPRHSAHTACCKRPRRISSAYRHTCYITLPFPPPHIHTHTGGGSLFLPPFPCQGPMAQSPHLAIPLGVGGSPRCHSVCCIWQRPAHGAYGPRAEPRRATRRTCHRQRRNGGGV